MKSGATLKTAVHVGLIASAFASTAFTATVARADDAPSFVDRKMSLAPLVIAADGALGIGHYNYGSIGNQSISGTGVGLNAEGSIGIIPHLTVGARVIGLNFGDDAKGSNAAAYGQMYDLQQATPSGALFSGHDTFSN
ncbi:MAG: hypothetical protein ABI461_05225, partial [Polyangiaceae bacterium]